MRVPSASSRRSRRTTSPPRAEWDYSAYRTIDTPEALAGFVEELKAQPRFCFDTETTSLDPLRADLVGLSFSWAEGEAAYIPVRGPMWSKPLDEATVLDALRPILADPNVEKLGQNVKYDMLVLHRSGVEIEAGPITDTMVLSYLLESGERNHSLDQLSGRLLDHTDDPDLRPDRQREDPEVTMDQVEVESVSRYAAEDADATWRIAAILEPRLREEGLWDLYEGLERPLIRVLSRDGRLAGIKVDVERLGNLSREFAASGW